METLDLSDESADSGEREKRACSLDVALDVEGVLSDTHTATEARSDFLEPEHCPPEQWEFPTDEHYEEFMHVSQNLWHNHAHEIPPQVDNLWKPTRKIYRRHDVDIVTHRNNVDVQMQNWLKGYNVYYDDFYATTQPKTEVGEYDVHIDDSPNVAADALSDGRYVVLVSNKSNQSVEPHRRLERVADITEAAEFLATCEIGINGLPK